MVSSLLSGLRNMRSRQKVAERPVWRLFAPHVALRKPTDAIDSMAHSNSGALVHENSCFRCFLQCKFKHLQTWQFVFVLFFQSRFRGWFGQISDCAVRECRRVEHPAFLTAATMWLCLNLAVPKHAPASSRCKLWV